MKKNGFTLIELLAVIVILAIIALIATPIILGIINDAKKESQERSAELYLSGVDLAVARRNLTEEFHPSECTISNGVVTCAGYEEPLNVDVDREVPVSGTIKFENNKATTGTTLNFNGFTATLSEEGKIEIGEREETNSTIEVGKLKSVCKPASGTEYSTTAGTKYNCKVDPNKPEYTFYVLTTVEVPEDAEEGTTGVNLIMDSNINISGNAVKEGVTDKGFVVWHASAEDNSYGPITAMNHLQTATKTWINVNPQTISTFTSCDFDGVCEDKTMTEYVGNARMPYYSEVSIYDSSTGSYAYLYDNLALICYDDIWVEEIACSESDKNKSGVDVEGIEYVSGVYGYWTLSAHDGWSNNAWYAHHDGSVWYLDVSTGSNRGVRPVITLDI